MNAQLRKSLTALLAILFFVLTGYGASPPPSRQAGQVRVLLTEWAGANTLDVGVWGSYLMDDAFSFQRGARLRLHEQGGRVMVYYQGMAYRGGSTVSLYRHQVETGEENGLRLEGRLHLMEGDLVVQAADGLLHLYLHIGIEDYLKGVVPYEMADTFPLEALKAQAVAARTYTLGALRGDRNYDVVDNTNDQVFRGSLEDQALAQRAVMETSGLALTYNGKPARAFYTASNGGQTESAYHAWGREHIPYLQLKDDPYDADNPLAEVRRARLPKTLSQEHSLSPWLLTQLHQGAVDKVESLGYLDHPDLVRVDGIREVQVHSPQFPGESRRMTRVRFELSVSASRLQNNASEEEVALFGQQQTEETRALTATEAPAAPGPVESIAAPVVVDLPYYPDMEQALGLSINVKQNEVITVSEEPDAFILQAARYGHGVGMSQRGAEWMALHHGMNHEEILAFYYPETELTHYDTIPAPRQPLDRDYLSTPGPRPTATPRPTLVPVSTTPGPDQYMVAVTGIARNSSLNLRAAPNTNSDVLYQLFHGQRLLVIAKPNEEWLEVEADGLRGFVMARFVTAE